MPETKTGSDPAVTAPVVSHNGQGPYVAPVSTEAQDVDPAETQEWLDSLEYVLNTKTGSSNCSPCSTPARGRRASRCRTL
jgi:hypothetical protein